VQLLLSIFIGWTILLSRVKADYSVKVFEASAGGNTGPGTSGAYPSASHRQIARTTARKGYDPMKAATIIGILLIVLGIIGYATGGISFTHEKKDVDLGAVQISHKTQDTLPLSPILSTISLVAGIGLVVVGVRSK
jgi:hypothetical protein